MHLKLLVSAHVDSDVFRESHLYHCRRAKRTLLLIQSFASSVHARPEMTMHLKLLVSAHVDLRWSAGAEARVCRPLRYTPRCLSVCPDAASRSRRRQNLWLMHSELASGYPGRPTGFVITSGR
jgi:hypothetical protein